MGLESNDLALAVFSSRSAANSVLDSVRATALLLDAPREVGNEQLIVGPIPLGDSGCYAGAVVPDGSKRGWHMASYFDVLRANFLQQCAALALWAMHVRFGSDFTATYVLSDQTLATVNTRNLPTTAVAAICVVDPDDEDVATLRRLFDALPSGTVVGPVRSSMVNTTTYLGMSVTDDSPEVQVRGADGRWPAFKGDALWLARIAQQHADDTVPPQALASALADRRP